MSTPRRAIRDAALELLRTALPAYPVRWADERTTRGDFDGRDFVIDVFGVPFSEQREVRRRLRESLAAMRELLGRSAILVFHTPEATARYYRDLLDTTSAIENAVFDATVVLRAHGDLSSRFALTLDSPSIRLLPAA